MLEAYQAGALDDYAPTLAEINYADGLRMQPR